MSLIIEITGLEDGRRYADRDEVDDAALDSFPASDPPGWTGLRIGPPEQLGLRSGLDDGVTLNADATGAMPHI